MKTFWTFFYWYLIDKTKIFSGKNFLKKKNLQAELFYYHLFHSFVLNFKLASQSILKILWWNTLKPNWKCFGAQVKNQHPIPGKTLDPPGDRCSFWTVEFPSRIFPQTLSFPLIVLQQNKIHKLSLNAENRIFCKYHITIFHFYLIKSIHDFSRRS